MAFFLKKSKFKKGIYLQIYESFYDPNRGHTAHRSHKALGYVDDLIEKGIGDPIAHFQEEVNQLNAKRDRILLKKQDLLISNDTPEKVLGYFPLKNINDSLGVQTHINFIQSLHGFEFNVFDILSSLIYARVVNPCSKHKTFHNVVPKLFDDYSYSENQMYDAIEYMGLEYDRIIEIYNHAIQKKYPFNHDISYFDCTNFYFEIDKEDSLRRKGPFKENRRDPIVGMGLLLDANQIPMGMKIFPGNQSEKPIIKDVINDLKRRQNITRKTVRVADKGLNSAFNIVDAIKSGDGYIFSKSVKMLPQTEKVWVLLEHDYKEIKDSDGNTSYYIKEWTDEFPYNVRNKNDKIIKVHLKEKRIVTYNPKLAKKKREEIHRQVETARNLSASQAKRNEYGDSSKYVVFKPADKSGKLIDGNVHVTFNEEKINEDLELAGYNMIVTSETNLSANEIYNTYHNLWRIEESFKVMKSDLDARPVFLQKENSIIGHFLICYLSVVLLRLFQFNILKNNHSTESILNFIRDFKAVKVSERQYINITKKTPFITALTDKTNLLLTSYHLSLGQIKKMLSHTFPVK